MYVAIGMVACGRCRSRMCSGFVLPFCHVHARVCRKSSALTDTPTLLAPCVREYGEQSETRVTVPASRFCMKHRPASMHQRSIPQVGDRQQHGLKSPKSHMLYCGHSRVFEVRVRCNTAHVTWCTSANCCGKSTPCCTCDRVRAFRLHCTITHSHQVL